VNAQFTESLNGRLGLMKKLLLRGVWIALAMMSVAASASAQQTYGDPVVHQDVPPLKIVAVDEKTAPAGWKRYQFGEPVLFSSLLPGQPGVQEARVSGSDGAEIVRSYYSTSGTAVYGVTYATDLPGAVEAKTEEQRLAAFKNFLYGFAEGVRKSRPEYSKATFNILTEQTVKVGGINGYEKEFTLGDYHGRAQMAFQGKSKVTLICLWGKANPAGERDAFFSSFKFGQQH
jgi:hypothetical protein